MYHVTIHPWIGVEPNQDIIIAKYQFETRDDAVEFVENYNAQALIKVALIQEPQLETV